jgi:hypothetical protein
LRLSASVFEPPWKVGVAPTVCPEDVSTVTLWPSGAALVKSITTLPAFAESDFVLYSSCPLEEAARLSVLAGTLDSPPAAGAPVLLELEELVDGVELAGASGVLADDVVFEELPQPARATIPTSTGTNASRLRVRCAFG